MTHSKPVVALRSALFFAGYAIIAVITCVSGMLLVSWMPFPARGRYLIFGNQLVLLWLRVCCGVRHRIVGELPSAPYVALAKHESQWETLFLQWYLFPVCVVLKRELLNVPFFGWALRMMHTIAIDRGSPREAMRETMEQGCQRLAAGYNVLVFPEGTRTAPGEIGRFARGGAGLAIKAGAPVVPIAHNAGQLWRTKSLMIYPGTVTVVIGEPMPSENIDSRELTLRVSEWIATQAGEIGG